MKPILQIHGYLETIAGFILLLNPNLLLNNHSPHIQGIAVAKMYGILALAFGLVSLTISKHFEYSDMYKKVILCIIAFHFVVGLYMYGLYTQHLTPYIGAAILHGSIAVVFLGIYLRNMQNFQKNDHSAS